MGTLLIPILLIPLIIAIGSLFRLCGRRWWWCNQVADHIESHWRWNASLGVLKESYGVASICVCIGFRSLAWDSAGGVINSVLVCFAPVFLIAPVVIGAVYMYQNYDTLSKKALKEKIGVAYEDLKNYQRIPFSDFISYPSFFFVRRLFLAMTVVFLKNHFYVQALLLIAQGLVATMILATHKPHLTRSSNYFEVMNEVAVLVTIYHLFLMTDYVQELKTKRALGYSMVGVMALQALICIIVSIG